ncbi:hypothetical protein GWI33_004378 [Rhynchophorus ferrugineus]|uniref:Uncharacterized protein n=1 Tax=Rhynchophorus ferrugineus TaxID=354439 RepID=A0A834MN05_RHYFE|nr:hypothetical protein GWI33_004378 [Rhynchophorus ferrugineus]
MAGRDVPGASLFRAEFQILNETLLIGAPVQIENGSAQMGHKRKREVGDGVAGGAVGRGDNGTPGEIHFRFAVALNGWKLDDDRLCGC